MSSDSGWAAIDQAQFRNCLPNVYLPPDRDFLANHNTAHITNYWAAWDLCNIASEMAIGIFTNRQDLYNHALDYVYNGPGDGAFDTVTNIDDDAAGVTATPVSGLITTEAGGTSFTVRLSSRPTAVVSIALSSSDPTEGTVAPAVPAFTPDNFATPQVVTITGVNDLVDDGDVSYTIVTAPATSDDPLYNNLDAADVMAVSIDDDTAGIVVTPPRG